MTDKTQDAELWYPRNPGNRDVVHVSLIDVRAADNLIISYDFERDGWRIGMDLTRDDDSGIIQVVKENQEVAFIPAWNETPNTPGGNA